jgi:hypothetical protein
MNRNRDYNGQMHTFQGERGKSLVEGLTMRDIADCVAQGMLAASGKSELQDKTVETSDEFKGTEYSKKGNWTYGDLYEIPDGSDPVAVIQNVVCFIEHMMGIYPNVPELTHRK